MNIAYVLNSTLRQGGASKSFITLLRGGMKHGVKPFVVVPDANGLYEDLQGMGVDVLVMDYRTAVYPWLATPSDYLRFMPRLIGRLALNRRASNQLSKELSKRNINLVHTNVSVIDIGFRAAKRLGLPHVYHIREYGDKDFDLHHYPMRKSFLRKLHSPSNYTVCITQDLQKYYGLQDNPNSRVIYNGIRSVQADCPLHSPGAYFLFAGRIEKAKGLDDLLSAYRDYVHRHQDALPLKIAGEVFDAELQKRLELFVKEQGLNHLVEFLGLRKDMEMLMRQARAVVVPSRFEAFGRCMPEAMFCGCLVIGRSTGGTQEQLLNGRKLTGRDIALSFDTVEQLSDCFKQATDMTLEDYQSMTRDAWHTVCHFYSAEASVDAVLQFYREIL